MKNEVLITLRNELPLTLVIYSFNVQLQENTCIVLVLSRIVHFSAKM